MLDTTPITTEITKLITAGTTEEALLAAVSYLFPNLTTAELSAARDGRGGAADCEEALRCPKQRRPT